MSIDIEAILNFVAEQAKAVAVLSGQLSALQKHSDKQAAELAELRKASCASENVPD